jgi:REP element-mobilizing transposase RayT
MKDHREFYQRHLPHWQPPGATLFVTFRLAGSLPIEAIKILQEEQGETQASTTYGNEHQNQGFLEEKRSFRKWDLALDSSNTGLQWLKQPAIAEILVEALHYRHMQFFDLFAYCIMPNHVHVVFKPLKMAENEYYVLNRIMQSMKRHTARQANRALGRKGKFWQAESYDHVIRDGQELNRIINYVISNPVKAGLVDRWEDWPWTYVRDEYNPFK